MASSNYINNLKGVVRAGPDGDAEETRDICAPVDDRNILIYCI